MPPGLLGCEVLTTKLSRILFTHIKHNLPIVVEGFQEASGCTNEYEEIMTRVYPAVEGYVSASRCNEGYPATGGPHYVISCGEEGITGNRVQIYRDDYKWSYDDLTVHAVAILVKENPSGEDELLTPCQEDWSQATITPSYYRYGYEDTEILPVDITEALTGYWSGRGYS